MWYVHGVDAGSYLKGRTRETTIRRDAQGRWFHDGQPLGHPNLIRSFEQWIERAEDGRWCLKNDINWAYITLEGPPLFVRAARPTASTVTLQLSNGRSEPLRPETLRQDHDGALYCDAVDGLTARFDRHAQTQLGEVLDEDDDGVYVSLDGTRWRPPIVDDPLNLEDPTA